MTAKTHKLIIFDADGTLRRTTVPGQPCPNRPGEWELISGVKEVLSKFNWGSPAEHKVGFGIASNQGGVGYGFLSAEMARALLADMVGEVFDGFVSPGLIQMCPHRKDDDCRCRKPEPLMLQRLMWVWNARPSDTLYVGDMDSDREAAERAGCDFMWAWEFFGWPEPTP